MAASVDYQAAHSPFKTHYPHKKKTREVYAEEAEDCASLVKLMLSQNLNIFQS